MATFTFTVDGVPTAADYVRFSNPTGTYGLRRTDTFAVIIANDTAWDVDGVGEYSYDFSGLLTDVIYDYWVEYAHAASGLATQRVQRFVLGGSETELNATTIRFCAIDVDGNLIEFNEAPVLENPSNNAGAVRTDSNEVVASPGTEFNVEGDSLYVVNFEQPSANLTYRYYVKAVLNDTAGTTYYLPRVTSYITSAALVLGRYTDSTIIEKRFGPENVHKWLGVDDGDQAVDYARRYWAELSSVEEEIDDWLRNTLPVPLSTVPAAIQEVATLLTACRLYDGRGIVDVGVDGEPQHRMSPYKKQAYQTLMDIKSGKRRLVIDETIRYPRFEETVIEEETTWLDSWETWS